jgi:hypothetical protein
MVRAWFSLTPRDYVLGLVKESATRPPEATATTIDGLPGWVMEANGMATIVAARPDGEVVVFAPYRAPTMRSVIPRKWQSAPPLGRERRVSRCGSRRLATVAGQGLCVCYSARERCFGRGCIVTRWRRSLGT